MQKICTGLAAAVLCSCAVYPALLSGAAPSATSSAFAHAIRENGLAALQMLASNAAAVNVRDRLQDTPLHYAAIYGSPEAVRILLNAGADPKARNQAGASSLVYAAWSFEKTRLLVESGAEVNTAENGGVTPLMVAASVQGNIATVRYLIEKGADVRGLDGVQGDALMRAASMSDPETLRVLLARGADPHLVDRAGFTALLNATAFPDSARIRLLLAAGADPNKLNTFGGKVLNGPIALVHLSPLMLAVSGGDEETVNALLKAGARVNEVDIRKMSPLMLSIATDHASPAVVRRLIAAGADVNAKDRTGESVLTWARKFRNPEIISVLEAAGAQAAESSPAPPRAAGTQPASASEAIHRGLPLLAGSGPRFFRDGGGCSGCHHQPIHARAFAAATHAGLDADSGLRKTFLDSMIAFRPRIISSLPLLSAPPGDYDVLLAYMTSFADLGEQPNEMTDLIVHYVAVRQDECGAWINLGIARPPIEDSTIARTAMAIRALKFYGWPARQPEFNERIRRARVWLENAKPVTTYEQADKIAGLEAAGVSTSDLRHQAAVLLRGQRADGGWAQTPYLDSDAYATGMVLHTLYTTGLASPKDAFYRRGVEFLLRTQYPDGSWYVRSRAPKFQPYFQSGFPFDDDQWISSAGTSLALMALAPAAIAAPIESARAAR
jgi:ankyrin repeat protein